MADPREIAEHTIRDAAEAITDADVDRATSVHRRRFGLTGEQAAALLGEVDKLIRSAVITVTWPGEILATIRTTEPEAAAQDITALLLGAGYDVDVTHG